MSQRRLQGLSGVSQSVISRAERGKAPRLALERLLAIQDALGGCLPLGICPHDHSCIWQPQSAVDWQARHAPARARWNEPPDPVEAEDFDIDGGTRNAELSGQPDERSVPGGHLPSPRDLMIDLVD